jgi:outer membrane lipoprotein-sorting protein
MFRFGVICLVGLWPWVADAETADDQGLAIAQAVDRRDQGWGDAQAELHMILRNKQGQESGRELRIQTLEVAGDGDKSLTIFDAPRDIAGTAFLSYTHALVPDDQWLYLPALKRVKRIASANKSGPFVGSEFAYEDLASAELQKYRYKWLRDESLADRTAHVLEETPAYAQSGYTRRIVWIDQRMLQPLKVEFYDRKNALLKTLDFAGYAQYLDRYWRPARMSMQNHQTGKRTELSWTNYRFRSGLTPRDFDQNTLKRAR